MKAMIIGIVTLLSAGILATADVIDNISNSLKSGDSEALSEYFMSSIDLTILDDEGVYSKSQAQQMVAKFFTDNVPNDFEVIHKKEQYCIGNLSTSKGTYRVTFFLKDGLISQLMFEED